MIGWKPAPTQPKPLERGSGKVSLKVLGSKDSVDFGDNDSKKE